MEIKMSKKVTICLNMIVRNEERVIKRCLESVKPLIDYWVIVDTGSEDRTQEIIRETLKDIPGELHERPWVNFAKNRTEAFLLAKNKGDLSLLIDADEMVVIEKDFVFPDATQQAYLAEVHYERAIFHRELFINNQLDWYWEGLLHEQIYCKQKLERITIAKKIYNLSRPDGNRSLNPKKYEKDIEVLQKALLEDPNNPRHMFYLAQSYACNQDWEMASKTYLKRSQMQGWNQEVYYSLYANGYMMERMGKDPYETIDAYAKAYQFRPSRVEPLFRVACLYFHCKQYALAKIIAKFGMEFPLSKDSMFVEPGLYQFGVRLLYADCCRALDEREEAIREYEKISRIKDVPDEVLADIGQHIIQLKLRPPKELALESVPYT